MLLFTVFAMGMSKAFKLEVDFYEVLTDIGILNHFKIMI